MNKYSYEELENKFYSYKDNNENEESRIIAEFYIKKAKKENKDKKYIAEGYVLNHYNKDLPVALKYIDSLEIISKNVQDERYPARIYLFKGMLYYNADNLKLALENYITALKYAKEKKNTRQIAIADLQIAYLNGYIGKPHEASKVLKYYYDNSGSLTNEDIQHIQINLAGSYLDIDEFGKAEKLIKNGLNYTLKNNEYVRYNRYLSLSGQYYLLTKQYPKSIEILEKAKAYFLKNNIDLDANYAMLYLGQSYAESKNKDKAVENYIKIDSIVQKTNNTFPELRDVYSYLIDYYKEKKDKEKQLFYIDRFLKINSILDTGFRYISRELPKKYDTPKLLSEKEEIIKELKNKKYLSYTTIGILCLLLIFIMILLVKAKRKENEYKKIAQDLIKSVSEKSHSTENKTENEVIANQEVFDSEKNKLPDEIVEHILKELKIFEEKEKYLKTGITVDSLAKKIKTNSSYLSKVVNIYKEKSFPNYLNDLRIDYALIRLLNDKKFRSYNFSVIASELGYNNEQAFAKAFKKRTGTTLTAFLKEIDGQL
ncbi:helix-turn-helix domain-containing protein [Kaistella sp.]|uniref:helix-turn-helix domain-containing protein n=1 Tax=Kaistella sp. TaxID=2782235 RepID=UPI003C356545